MAQRRIGLDHTVLKALRAERGLTFQQLADRAGVSEPAVRALEAGKNQPRVDTLARIARALGVELVTLLHQPRAKSEAAS